MVFPHCFECGMLRGKRSIQAEDANHLIHNTYNIKSNNSLINRVLMVNGSWLKGARPGCGGGEGGDGPMAPAELPGAMSHEP